VLGSLYALVGYLLWSDFDLIFQISVSFWHTFLILIISSVSEIIQYMEGQRDLQATVHQDLIDKKRVLRNHVENHRHEISKHLHGFLITKIHSSTSLLDRYAESGDFEGYRDEFSRLLSEFTIEGLQKSLNRDVINSEFFSALVDSWKGMIEVSLNAPENLHRDVRNTQRIELAHVIEELISNAYRHGEAQAITINIAWIDPAFFEIVARDDGQGTITPVKPGLGSKVFEAASRGNWSLRDIPYQGVEVRLTIELYEPDSQVALIPAEHEDADQPVGHTL
jgi:glucose-6-phosphate-specific signal transduction histidine kinase